jgi:hypothetical protein
MKFGKAKHKDHVTGVAPGTTAAMGRMFGIPIEKFMAAVYGDHEAIKDLRDAGRLSEIAQQNLEPALEAARLTIQTTGDINQAVSALIGATQQTGQKVISAANSAELSEQKLHHSLTEAKTAHGHSVRGETGRHLRQMNLIEINGSVADLMSVTKYQTDLSKAKNKVPLAQQKADMAYESAVSKALWAQGSDADLSRIPKPNYRANRNVGGLANWFRDTFGI